MEGSAKNTKSSSTDDSSALEYNKRKSVPLGQDGVTRSEKKLRDGASPPNDIGGDSSKNSDDDDPPWEPSSSDESEDNSRGESGVLDATVDEDILRAVERGVGQPSSYWTDDLDNLSSDRSYSSDSGCGEFDPVMLFRDMIAEESLPSSHVDFFSQLPDPQLRMDGQATTTRLCRHLDRSVLPCPATKMIDGSTTISTLGPESSYKMQKYLCIEQQMLIEGQSTFHSSDNSTDYERSPLCLPGMLHRVISILITFVTHDTISIILPGTKRVDVIDRGSIGCYFSSNFHQKYHYEIPKAKLHSFETCAEASNIETRIHLPISSSPGEMSSSTQNGVLIEDADTKQFLWICNGVDFQGMISGLELDKLANELFFNDLGKIPARDDNRNNRMISVGYATSIANKYKSDEATSCPVLMSGTMHLAPFFVQFTTLMQEMSKVSKRGDGKPYEVPEGDRMDDRSDNYAKVINESNRIEAISIIVYIHAEPHLPNLHDMLMPHFDVGNCPVENWNYCGAAYLDYFQFDIGRYVTVVATGQSRKSISDTYLRVDVVDEATDYLLKQYMKEPEERRIVTSDSLLDVNHDGAPDYCVKPIHFETNLFLMGLFHWMEKFASLNDRLSAVEESPLLPVMFAVDVVYAFFTTNNPYRFHRFCDHFYEVLPFVSFVCCFVCH